MLNVAMIASVLWLAPHFGKHLSTQIFALAVGVLAAGAAQAAFQIPTLWTEGFRYRWVTPWQNETVRLVVRKMIPATIGVAAFQINVLLTDAVAFFVDPQIVASFDYAVRLMEFPQGIFGISLATYLLTALSGLAAEKNYAGFRTELRNGIGYLFFVNLIASVLLVVLAEPIVRLLFERREFSSDATQRAAFALACLAPGLVAFSLVNILARAFYALGDTQTPMRISLLCLSVNLVLGVTFLIVLPLKQGGLGLANTLSGTLNAALLLFALRKKLARLELSALRVPLLNMLGAVSVAGTVAWFARRFWETNLGHANLLTRAGEVFVPMALAGLAYLGLTLLLKVGPAKDILGLIRRKPGN